MSLRPYKLRIRSHDKRAIEKFLNKHAEDGWVYSLEIPEHNPDNKHIHAYFATVSKEPTMRDQLRRAFGAGNKNYSLLNLDEIMPKEWLAYLLKQGDYVVSPDFPDLTPYLDYDKIVKESMKSKKRSAKTVLQEVIDILESQIEYDAEEGTYSYISDNTTTYLSESHIVDLVLKYYKDKGTLVRRFQIVSICQTLCLKYIDSYHTRFSNSILAEVTRE